MFMCGCAVNKAANCRRVIVKDTTAKVGDYDDHPPPNDVMIRPGPGARSVSVHRRCMPLKIPAGSNLSAALGLV